jgi:hypothetical protein
MNRKLWTIGIGGVLLAGGIGLADWSAPRQ